MIFNKRKIEKLNSYKFDIFEPKLNSILKNKEKIYFTDQIDKLKNCKLIYYVYDTETSDKNIPNYSNQKIRIKKNFIQINKKKYFHHKISSIPRF